MKSSRIFVALCLLTLLVIAGCASTKVTSRERTVTGPLPRPQHIWVYDFIATPADIPADSEFAGQYDTPPQTDEDIATGRELGAQIGGNLAKRIWDMGLPAARGSRITPVQINDLVIRGYLLSIDEGSAAKRIAIGFGSGSSQLKTAVETFQVTAQGLRKLGSGTVDAGGSRTPGAAMGTAGLLVTGNPAGLIIGTGVKVYGEASGSSKVEGRAKQTAQEIADALKKRFQEAGWIK